MWAKLNAWINLQLPFIYLCMELLFIWSKKCVLGSNHAKENVGGELKHGPKIWERTRPLVPPLPTTLQWAQAREKNASCFSQQVWHVMARCVFRQPLSDRVVHITKHLKESRNLSRSGEVFPLMHITCLAKACIEQL